MTVGVQFVHDVHIVSVLIFFAVFLLMFIRSDMVVRVTA